MTQNGLTDEQIGAFWEEAASIYGDLLDVMDKHGVTYLGGRDNAEVAVTVIIPLAWAPKHFQEMEPEVMYIDRPHMSLEHVTPEQITALVTPPTAQNSPHETNPANGAETSGSAHSVSKTAIVANRAEALGATLEAGEGD